MIDCYKWIPVSEKLPEDCDLVYFCTNSGGVGFGQLDEDGICTVNYFPLRALGDVTHWMPLPEPPSQ